MPDTAVNVGYRAADKADASPALTELRVGWKIYHTCDLLLKMTVIHFDEEKRDWILIAEEQ